MLDPNAPQQPAQPGGFDIQGFIQMMQQLAQQRQVAHQQMHTQDSNLGAVGTSNSRPMGLTDNSAWERMFPARPQGAGFEGGMGYTPSQQTNAQGALGASQQQPYAQALSRMPAQSQFVGQDPRMDMPPPQQPPMQSPFMSPQPPQRKPNGFGASAYPGKSFGFGASAR